VNEIAPHEKLMPRAIHIADEIGNVKQSMLKTIKELMEMRREYSLNLALAVERQRFEGFAVKKKFKV
jgi:enoyl-CoA hydratase/carnithine racemase